MSLFVYTHPTGRRNVQLSQDYIGAQCYITDSIYGINSYYSKIVCASWGNTDELQAHIGIDSSQSGRIILSAPGGNSGEQKEVVIYEFTTDLEKESDLAVNDAEGSSRLNTKKEVIVTMARLGGKHALKAVAGLIPGGGTVLEMHNGGKDAYSIWEAYRSSEAYNAENIARMQGLELQGMSDTLNCCGTVIQYGIQSMSGIWQWIGWK